MPTAAASAFTAVAASVALAAVGLACVLLLLLRGRRLGRPYRWALLLMAVAAVAWAALRYATA